MSRLPLTICLLLAGFTARLHASEMDAAIAKAEQLSAASRWEEAITALEDVMNSLIGDPAVVKAAGMAQKYYVSWCDSLHAKPDSHAAYARTLIRFKAKQSDSAKTYGVDEKLKKALEDWQAEAQKKKNYQPLLDSSTDIAAAIGDDGANWRRTLYKTALTEGAEDKDPTAFVHILLDYVKAFHNTDDLAPALKKKGVTALLGAAEKLAAAPMGMEDALRLCKQAQGVSGPDDADPKMAQIQEKCALGIAKYYEGLHDTDLARLWYESLINKSTNKTLITDCQKATDALAATTKQNAVVTMLPAELTKATTIKALPVPYLINDTMVVKTTAALTIEKGVCIRGGKLLFENSTLALHGTRDAPIIFDDVEIGTKAERAKLTITGEYVVFVHSPLSHIDNMYFGGQHKFTLKNCIFIGPAEMVFYATYGYDFSNCSYCDYKLKVCREILKPADFITGPISINATRCDVDPRFLFSVDKVNFAACNLMTDEKYTLKLHKVFTQKSAWIDRDSPTLLSWKTYIIPDASVSGKAELIPMPDKNPACGPEWSCLSFQKPE